MRLPAQDFWKSRRVLITGHTGFKGSWLTMMANQLGGSVYGLSNGIPTEPSLFVEADVRSALVDDLRIDVRDPETVAAAMQDIKPEVVFHLAAQPLVIEGLRNPADTFAINVMGTVNVLEAARRVESIRACVVVTTDKVYQSGAVTEPHSELDALGGDEPYGASKVAAEMAAAGYAACITDTNLRIATARAGNVIGGGDWSPWRLLPDILAAVDAGSPVGIRSPTSVRPWQHVLDPLVGYLLLAESMDGDRQRTLPSSWNFGPEAESDRRVLEVIREVERSLGKRVGVAGSESQPAEAAYLALSSSRARELLGWRPHFDFATAVADTVSWHQSWRGGADMAELSRQLVERRLKGDS